MIIVTTDSIQGWEIEAHRGVVASEVIFGNQFLSDILGTLAELIGGEDSGYEAIFSRARFELLRRMTMQAIEKGCDAILSVRFNYQMLGEEHDLMLIAASGTAVKLSGLKIIKGEDELRYTFARGGRMIGPFSKKQLREMLNAGNVEPSLLVFHDSKSYIISEIFKDDA